MRLGRATAVPRAASQPAKERQNPEADALKRCAETRKECRSWAIDSVARYAREFMQLAWSEAPPYPHATSRRRGCESVERKAQHDRRSAPSAALGGREPA